MSDNNDPTPHDNEKGVVGTTDNPKGGEQISQLQSAFDQLAPDSNRVMRGSEKVNVLNSSRQSEIERISVMVSKKDYRKKNLRQVLKENPSDQEYSRDTAYSMKQFLKPIIPSVSFIVFDSDFFQRYGLPNLIISISLNAVGCKVI